MTTGKLSLKERLKRGKAVIGTWSNMPSSPVINALGYSGLDFVIIDAEHSSVSMETAENLVRASEASGITPIIRVPSLQSHLILRALDVGAHGVQVPHVSGKDEAAEVVKYAKFFPEGERGFTPFTRAGRYGSQPEGYTDRANKETMVIVNIEGKKGIANLKDITKVKGIDVIFIGPFDLSQSLGIPGKVTDPKVIKGIRDGVKFCRDNGLACGSYAPTLSYLDILMDCGVQYVTYVVDAFMLLQSYKQACEYFYKKIGAVKK